MSFPQPPRRLRPRHLPPPAPSRDTRTRVRRLVERHEREERPFDPERAPDWRGSSKDLVVNASGFRTDLRELVEHYHPKLRSSLSADDMVRALAEAFRDQKTDEALELANELLDGHGIESLGAVDMEDGPAYLYINFGDTYDPTIMWSRDDNKVFVAMGGWGDVWSEEGEPNAMQEAWEGHVRREFRRKMEGEFEGSGDEASAERFDELDEQGERELFDRAVMRAANGARDMRRYPEWVQESDGYTFVNMAPVVTEAAHMLSEGWRPGQFEGHAKNPFAARRNGSVSATAMDELGSPGARDVNTRMAWAERRLADFRARRLSRDALRMFVQMTVGWSDMATGAEARRYAVVAREAQRLLDSYR